MIIQKIIENELGIDNLFKKTKKREYIEARSIYDKVLKDFFNKTLVRIGKDTGRNHATIINSLNGFEVHSRYNKKILEIYHKVIFELNKQVIVVYDVDLKNNIITFDY